MQTHAPEGFQITLSNNIINHSGNDTAIHKQGPTQTHIYNDIYIERHQSHTHHTYGHTHPHTSKLPSVRISSITRAMILQFGERAISNGHRVPGWPGAGD